METESIISKVQGVVSGKVVCSNGQISEVHILANGKRSPKQIVRDIESAVLVKSGVELNHKKISVAQLNSNMEMPVKKNNRLHFKRIRYSCDNRNTAVEITIANGSQSYTSLASGPNNKQNRLHLTAEAVLSAIEKSIKTNGMLTVAEVQKLHIGGQSAIAVAVCLNSNSQEDILLGTALLKGDDLESTVRATLDAINRRTAILKNN